MYSPFDPKHIPAAQGFHNTGAICYLNSFVQALSACSSLNEYYMHVKPPAALVTKDPEQPSLARAIYTEYVAAALAGKDTSTYTSKLHDALIIDLLRAEQRLTIAHAVNMTLADPQLMSSIIAPLIDTAFSNEATGWGSKGSGAPLPINSLNTMAAFERVMKYVIDHKPITIGILPDRMAGAMQYVSNMRVSISFGAGQEDSDEFFVKLFDVMADPGAFIRFNHKYLETVICPECKFENVGQSIAPRIQMQAGEYNHDEKQFVDALRTQVQQLDAYTCPKCKKHFVSGPNVTVPNRIAELKSSPVCLTIVFTNKYQQKITTWFPPELHFNAGKTTFTYKLVSQVEHYGSMGGGHYVARALRAVSQPADSAKPYLLNDQSATPCELGPTENTYLVMYHFEG